MSATMVEKNKRNHYATGKRVTRRRYFSPPAEAPANSAGVEKAIGRDNTEFVPLPRAPRTTSPVALTSIHATPGRGNYGDPAYRGNCSGLLIKDLLRFFQPKRVLDPMAGGGTCGDVCYELGIQCESMDLTAGFDAGDPGAYAGLGKFDFVWLHPPYWRMIQWSDDSRCLANAPTVGEYFRRLDAVLRNCRNVLEADGHLAVLIGDLRFHGTYQALPFRAYMLAEVAGFELAAPEIIRFSHGTTSSKRSEYRFSFIPRLHDVCLVFRKRRPYAGKWPASA
jgi:hypothetical protein